MEEKTTFFELDPLNRYLSSGLSFAGCLEPSGSCYEETIPSYYGSSNNEYKYILFRVLSKQEHLTYLDVIDLKKEIDAIRILLDDASGQNTRRTTTGEIVKLMKRRNKLLKKFGKRVCSIFVSKNELMKKEIQSEEEEKEEKKRK